MVGVPKPAVLLLPERSLEKISRRRIRPLERESLAPSWEPCRRRLNSPAFKQARSVHGGSDCARQGRSFPPPRPGYRHRLGPEKRSRKWHGLRLRRPNRPTAPGKIRPLLRTLVRLQSKKSTPGSLLGFFHRHDRHQRGCSLRTQARRQRLARGRSRHRRRRQNGLFLFPKLGWNG